MTRGLRRLLRHFLVISCMSLALHGCGQKGRLYLPDLPPEEQAAEESE